MLANGRALIWVALFFSGPTHADLDSEITQQQEIEARLQSELAEEKKLSEGAYQEVFEFVDGSSFNRREQIIRLESANEIWDEFIGKTCEAQVLEAIGTRAERANTLRCMIERYKDKKNFFSSLI